MDTRDVTPAGLHTASRDLLIQVEQAIHWSHDRTGRRVRTSQIHEAVIRGTATIY